MAHDELMARIRKSLYFGDDSNDNDMKVSRPLADYASELFSEPHKGHSLNRLSKMTAGSVNADAATPCSLILALIYLDRLNANDPSYVRRTMPSELFIVAMMLSAKFYYGYDEEVYLDDWAEDANIDEERLKVLELEFLDAIDWNLYVSNDQFFEKLGSVEMVLAKREGIRRGWLTYTELLNLLPSFTIAKFLLKSFAVMTISYTASVMTIAGAFFIASHIPGNALTTKSTQTDVQTSMPTSSVDLKTNSHTNLTDMESDQEAEEAGSVDVEDRLKAIGDGFESDSNDTTSSSFSENDDGTTYKIIVDADNHKLDFRADTMDHRNWKSWIMDAWNGQRNSSLALNDDYGNKEKSLMQLPFIWFKFI